MPKLKCQDNEEPFVKAYYKALRALLLDPGVVLSQTDLAVLFSMLGKCRLGSSEIDVMSKDVAEDTGLSPPQISKSIKRLLACELLKKKESKKYQLNGWYFWRGKQAQRKAERQSNDK